MTKGARARPARRLLGRADTSRAMGSAPQHCTLRGDKMQSDRDIQRDIVNELNWEPSLRNDDIAVGVRDGVVTLAGFVDTYADKWTAERVAGRVKGVKAVANDIEVKLPLSSSRPDPEIAPAALDPLQWHGAVAPEGVQVKGGERGR